MRIMFLTTDFTRLEWGAALDGAGITYVYRRLWTHEGCSDAYIVSETDFVTLRDWHWAGLDLSLYWSITSCNKQYVTAIEGEARKYLGCIAVSDKVLPEIIGNNDEWWIVTGPDPKSSWIIRYEGSPSRLIHDFTSQGDADEVADIFKRWDFANAASALKDWDNERFPVDPAAPPALPTYGKSVPQDLKHQMDTIGEAISVIVVQLNRIARIRHKVSDNPPQD